MKKIMLYALTAALFPIASVTLVNNEQQSQETMVKQSPSSCKVSRTGRVTCRSSSSGPRVWNNGKSRGYYWP
jgi:hypothetical protein